MALDKLVDSTKLDACLDAEADAIRAKTGGASDILFDFANNKGFADAIAAIQTGGGETQGIQFLFSEEFTVTTSDKEGSSYTINMFFRDFALVTTNYESTPFVYVLFAIDNTSTENSAGIYAATMAIAGSTSAEVFMNNGGGGGIRKNGSKTTASATTFRIGLGSVIKKYVYAPKN